MRTPGPHKVCINNTATVLTWYTIFDDIFWEIYEGGKFIIMKPARRNVTIKNTFLAFLVSSNG